MEGFFVVISFVATRLLQNFAYAMTAELSWHVQNFVVITLPKSRVEQLKFLTNLDDGEIEIVRWACSYVFALMLDVRVH